jgi:YVTN family beta-propeller protein
MKVVKLGAVLALTAWLMGCGGGNAATVSVTISPPTATVIFLGTQQFTVIVSGNSNQNVTWAVNNVKGGNSTVGTISTSGLYTAPATLPNPAAVVVSATSVASPSASATAVVTIDSGIRVTVTPAATTIGTSETLAFTATVTGTANTALTWSVNGIDGGNATVGTITSAGVYTAPASVPSPGTVSITATSVADTTKSGSATVTVIAAADPTLNQIGPQTAAQGSVFLDVYLTGSNFLTTTVAQVNGTAVPTSFLNTTLLRARIPDSFLTATGTLSITAARQNGTASLAQTLTVVATRPALISSTQDSATQNGASFTLGLIGGYFGTSTAPGVTAEFNGQSRVSSVVNTRQLNVALQGNPDLLQPGLFPVIVRNPSASPGAPAVSSVNLAVEPAGGGVTTNTLTVGSQPSAVAINTATNVAIVANRGGNSISIIDLGTNAVTSLAVGSTPTGVAADNVRNIAAVVNSGSGTLSVVNLAGPSLLVTLPLPSATTPFSVGLNPLTGRALVASAASNTATVVDLSTPASPAVVGTVNISTGPAPGIAIEPRLNWAIVTPGGSGILSIVDLGRPASGTDAGRAPFVVATLGVATSTRGIALNTETEEAVLSDPSSTLVSQFSVLDQNVTGFTLDSGEVAVAVNPLTDIGVLVNNATNIATVVDLRTRLTLTTAVVGTAPQAVALDPASNVAVVANTGSSPGTVSILSLGNLRPLHITQTNPATTFTAAAPCGAAPPLTLQVIGNGFNSGSLVRLDETPLPLANITFLSSRRLTATIPACMLTTARRYIVDVQNPDTTVSNTTDLTVMQAIAVGTAPQGVALDTEHGLAVVTNSGSNSISLVNLSTGTVAASLSVGVNPQGVAALPLLGRAIVSNNGSNTATIVDLLTKQILATIPVGVNPLGVAINPDTGVAFVANSGSNNVSSIHLDTLAGGTVIPVDQRPEAVAVDTIDDLVGVTATTQRTVDFINMTTNFIVGRLSNFQGPTGIAFDPVSGSFLVANSLQNNLNSINPLTLVSTPIRVGINPSSVDYNFQSGELVTVNSLSRTVSVMDFQGQRVRAVLGIDGSTQFSVAIDPQTNIAYIADTRNNRLLVVPLPR